MTSSVPASRMLPSMSNLLFLVERLVLRSMSLRPSSKMSLRDFRLRFPFICGSSGLPDIWRVVWRVPVGLSSVVVCRISAIRLSFSSSVSMMISQGVGWAKNLVLSSMSVLNGILPVMLAMASP